MSIVIQRRRVSVTHPYYHNARPWEHRHSSTPRSRYPNYIGRDIHMVEWNANTLARNEDKASSVLRPNAVNSHDYLQTALRTRNMCQQHSRLGRDLAPQPFSRVDGSPIGEQGQCAGGRGLRPVLTGREIKAMKARRQEMLVASAAEREDKTGLKKLTR